MIIISHVTQCSVMTLPFSLHTSVT